MLAASRFSRWFGLLGVALLVAGCAAVPGPTGGAPAAGSTGQANTASLTALQVAVQRLRDGAPDASLALGDRVDLLPKDRITIDDQGRGLLKFQDNLAVELFRGSKMEIAGTYLDPAGFTLVRLKQTLGHSRIELMKEASTRVELDTDYATITALADNTEILTWHEPGSVTCIVATNGAAEVEAQGQKVDLKAGQTTFVLPGQAPPPATCAHLDEVGPWLDKLRGTGQVRHLDELVKSWAGKPCPPTAQGPASPQASPAVAGTAAPAGATGAAPPAAASPTTAPASPAATAQGQAASAGAATSTPATPAAPLPSGQGMVPIKAGAYTLGGPTGDANHVAAHSQALPGSFIDANLVTFAQYQVFLNATGRPAPTAWAGHSFPAGHEQYPVEGLTLDDAGSYCAFVHKRLPSEAEWEAAGRGPGANPPIYPWGNDPTAGGKVDQITPTDTYPAGSLAFNKSPLGVFDLTGAVWQWVAPPYAPAADGLQILRGGRHGFLQDLTYRQPARPDDERFTRFAGVRCAADQVNPAG